MKQRRWAYWVSAALAILLLAGAVQGLARNWQGNEIASHPDEAAHFVTGMMVFDYLRGHLGENPVAFAESYYARFPKVAIGHWPPGYYALQSGWYWLMGAGVKQAHALNLVLALALALVWWWKLRAHMSWTLAMGGLGFCFSIPVFQNITSLVLSDLAVVLGCWLTMLLWERALQHGGWVAWSMAAVVAAATILIKGNAWPLAPVLVMAYWLTAEQSNRKRIAALALGVAVAALAAPFYLYARSEGWSYPLRNLAAATEADVVVMRLPLWFKLLQEFPWPLWLFSAAGIVLGFLEGRRSLHWAFASVFLFATGAFLWISGLSYEDRTAAPMWLFALMLALTAVARCSDYFEWCGPLFLAGLLVFRTDHAVSAAKGFRELAAAIPTGERATAVLVASDSGGEGAMVAHRLELDEPRRGVVLRASRLLSQQNWDGLEAEELHRTPQEIQALLQSIGVHYVLIDSRCPNAYASHLRVLARNWALLQRRRSAERILELYEIPENRGRTVQAFSFSLGREREGKVIRYAGDRP